MAENQDNSQNQDGEEIEIQHRKMIEEDNVDISSLPKEIRAAMRDFNKKLEKYEESGEESLFLELQQDDVNIANNILTFLEDNESEEEEEIDTETEEEEKTVEVKKPVQKPVQKAVQKPVEEPKVEVKQEVKQEEKPVEQKQETTPPPPAPPVQQVQTPPPPVEETPEQKIKSALKDEKGKKIIAVEVLESILGREADYPYEQIGAIKLKKQYMRPFYEVA